MPEPDPCVSSSGPSSSGPPDDAGSRPMASADASGHAPVLVAAVLGLLDPRPGEVLVDCTVGRGGHAEAIGQRLGPTGRIVGLDLDLGNLEFATTRLARTCSAAFTPIHASFVEAPRRLESLGQRADILLADLGFSSSQMDDPTRGFSFRGDGPLDMRLDPSRGRTAAELLQSLSEREIADMIFTLGEEPLARRIARKLAQQRRSEPIRNTTELARLVEDAYGSRARTSRLHPATRTFMALRIAVNDELNALSSLLRMIAEDIERMPASRWLNPGARIGIIGFHSLEDRLVKHAFADLARRGLVQLSSRKPVVADEREIGENPRARSAKFRVVTADVSKRE
ncbi:MAG: 16S rRNA (cytosine(1402)-N(4))-methyltransferase RsmH [Phycisphaerales bacterium]|nr:16S rRNA (cytosine(1402)-N(4))-methyltransferase RsmH [Phycisphaerales bacterium]